MPTLTASQIYALSQGSKCEGDRPCHYCGGPCGRDIPHGEAIRLFTGRPVGGVRRNPSSPYMCVGCWLWRKKKVSVPWLSGGVKDGGTPARFDWVVGPAGAWGISPACRSALYRRLLSPEGPFFLMLWEGDGPPDHVIQCCPGNDGPYENTTEIGFALNNHALTYSVHELEQAARLGPQGRDPGVRALLRVLGDVPAELTAHLKPPERPEDTDPKGRGRPPKFPDGRVNVIKNFRPGNRAV